MPKKGYLAECTLQEEKPEFTSIFFFFLQFTFPLSHFFLSCDTEPQAQDGFLANRCLKWSPQGEDFQPWDLASHPQLTGTAAKQLNPCASTYPHCYLSWWFSSRFICLTKPKNCPRAVCCRSNVFRAVLHPAVHCTQPCTQALLCRCSLVFRLMTWGRKGPFFPSPLFLNHKNGIIHSPISRYRDIISLKSLNRLFFCLLVNRKRLC